MDLQLIERGPDRRVLVGRVLRSMTAAVVGLAPSTQTEEPSIQLEWLHGDDEWQEGRSGKAAAARQSRPNPSTRFDSGGESGHLGKRNGAGSATTSPSAGSIGRGPVANGRQFSRDDLLLLLKVLTDTPGSGPRPGGEIVLGNEVNGPRRGQRSAASV